MTSSKSLSSPGKLNLLVAYPYMNKQILGLLKEHAKDIRFVLDSGAFTAWKAGKSIDLDTYCAFLDELPIKPWRYFALDVVGDPKATKQNYEAMLKRGYKPVPIFTRGEEIDELDWYYNTSDVVGIGGLVGTEGNRGFVKGIMERVGKRRVHWLGFTELTYMKLFRPYMADSSSWEMGARFGAVNVYLGGGRQCKFTRKTVKKDLQDARLRGRLIQWGMNPFAFLDDSHWEGGRSGSRVLGSMSIVAIQKDYLERFGTHVFAAATTDYAIRLLLEAREKIYAKEIT